LASVKTDMTYLWHSTWNSAR